MIFLALNFLKSLDYHQTRQVGSHIRLTTSLNGTHHITIPKHRPITLGTLSGILKDEGQHLGTTKEEVWERISKK